MEVHQSITIDGNVVEKVKDFGGMCVYKEDGDLDITFYFTKKGGTL